MNRLEGNPYCAGSPDLYDNGRRFFCAPMTVSITSTHGMEMFHILNDIIHLAEHLSCTGSSSCHLEAFFHCHFPLFVCSISNYLSGAGKRLAIIIGTVSSALTLVLAISLVAMFKIRAKRTFRKLEVEYRQSKFHLIL